MSMTTYLPLYSKPTALADPSLVFSLGLNKDGPTFHSDDMYSRHCNKYGALWTPHGYYLDGNDDVIEVVSTPWLSLPDASTYSCWTFFISDPSPVTSLAYLINLGYNGVMMVDTYWNLGFSYWDNVTWRGAGTFIGNIKGIWTHLAASLSRLGTQSIVCSYINGVLRRTQTLTGQPTYWSSHLTVGGNSPLSSLRTYTGYIALPKIFNRALSPLEMRAIYDSERALFL